MASISMKQAFTLIESLVVIFLFTSAIVLISQIYLNLIKSTIQTQGFQLAFDNIRFGTEKIWNEVKSGSEFSLTPDSLEFRNRKCQIVKFVKKRENLIFELANREIPIFDNNLVNLKSFKIYSDKPETSAETSDAYYKTANKVFIFEYSFDLKVKTNLIPFTFYQTVAPSNSVLINKPCL